MAKRIPFTSQEERLERLIKNARSEVVALKGMIDTARSVVAAEHIKMGTPASPQIIRVSEEGSLEAGGEPLLWWRAITVAASHTGDTSWAELGKITVPANKMGPNGFVRVSAHFYGPEAGSDRYFRVLWANNEFLWNHYNGVWPRIMYDIPPKIIWNQGVTNAQGSGIKAHHHWRVNEVSQNYTEDTTQDVDVVFQVKCDNAAHTTWLRFALVEVFYAD
jgi:hypothetical protein